jgi:hypothetical protein
MKFSAIMVIAPDDLEQIAIERARAAGATGITILQGKGISNHAKKTFFGMTFEGNQTVLLMIVARHIALPILKEMKQILFKQGDSRGIAFTLPIEHLVGIDLDQIAKFEQPLREQQPEGE